MSYQPLQAFVISVDNTAVLRHTTNNLSDLQGLVGGRLEFVPISDPDSAVGEIHGYVHDEGAFLPLPINDLAVAIISKMCGRSAEYRGTMILFSMGKDGEECTLRTDQIQALTKRD